MPSMPGPGHEAPVAVTRPPAMDRAVQLMKVGAVLSLINLLLTFVMKDTVRDVVEKAAADAGTTVTPEQLDAAVTASLAVGVVSGLIGAGLWLWMASANGKGRGWARIVATVFFALQLLSFLANLTQPLPTPLRLMGIVTTVLGAVIIFLLYRPESTRFYRESSAPRY
ncbi:MULTISPECIES: hypothetical protein [unclassified Janibacter]|uniref:hypothetical protein n=1 Tax=unclassified Janibacter TaxID=2649294 RepID=UPI003D08B6A5